MNSSSSLSEEAGGVGSSETCLSLSFVVFPIVTIVKLVVHKSMKKVLLSFPDERK
jgi:hypothetical protein